MELRWTEAAAEDLERIADYLFKHSPLHAARIVRMIYESPRRLLTFPALGRPGKVDGTRELVWAPLPYVLVYISDGEIIHLARIPHGAQTWP